MAPFICGTMFLKVETFKFIKTALALPDYGCYKIREGVFVIRFAKYIWILRIWFHNNITKPWLDDDICAPCIFMRYTNYMILMVSLKMIILASALWQINPKRLTVLIFSYCTRLYLILMSRYQTLYIICAFHTSLLVFAFHICCTHSYSYWNTRRHAG